MMKTKPIALDITSSLISCEPISCRHICKGSYSSGGLNNNEIFIVVNDGTSYIVVSGRRSIRISLGSSSTLDREETSSCSGTNSLIAFAHDSSLSSIFGSGSGSLTISALCSRIFTMSTRISLHSATRSLNCDLSRCGAYRIRRSYKTNQSQQSI